MEGRWHISCYGSNNKLIVNNIIIQSSFMKSRRLAWIHSIWIPQAKEKKKKKKQEIILWGMNFVHVFPALFYHTFLPILCISNACFCGVCAFLLMYVNVINNGQLYFFTYIKLKGKIKTNINVTIMNEDGWRYIWHQVLYAFTTRNSHAISHCNCD